MQHSVSPPIELQDVWFAYQSGPILQSVSLTVQEKDYLLLVGANGSGKTTLLKVALGLLQPSAGEALLFGRPAVDARARARVGYVPQRAAVSAHVPATAAEVVVSGRAGRRWVGGYSRLDRDSARDALDRVGLGALAPRRIGELSGGEQQRVLIARALVSEPALLVLDEPTAGVDQESQLRFANLLRGLHTAGMTIVVVAHDLGALGRDITRVVALHQGHIDELVPEEARAQIGLFVEDHPA